MSTDTQKLKSLWQSLPSEKLTFSHEQMQRRADKFQAKHKRRDVIEYLGWGVFFLLVVYILSVRATVGDLVFCGLGVAGAIVAILGYYRRMGSRKVAASNSSEKLVDFMRRELTRQRDGAASLWRWYVLPFAPAMVFLFVIRWVEFGETAVGFTEMRVELVIVFGFMIAFFVACILWSLLCAARYQRQLDELERL